MSAPSPATAHHRSRVGGLALRRKPDDPDLAAARRDLELSKLADHVSKIIAGWPELPDERLDRIAALLRAGSA